MLESLTRSLFSLMFVKEIVTDVCTGLSAV